ncbi:hypothetical protein PMZ80_002683 [Knufia obscura]|uniref:CRAL-TRIO domain-containing protein n=1 Tax=Knufia obscura TaxID=1635080 RepID=A0ABR0RY17_9EURO|nr:hypothetical protein PMZ80_002683 [Knufia obscura]
MAQQLYRTLTGQSQNSKTDGSPATPTSLSRMTTTNTQTGVLNHLTEQQEHKLVEFKEKLQADGWWSPDGINGKPTHDDGTLLRYLRARKFDVQGAYGQFTDTEKWLKEQHVEELYEHFDVDFFERARLMYPQWTGHRDRRGIPIYVFEIKGLDSKAVDKYQKEATSYKAKLPKHKNLDTLPKLLPLFALYHNLLNFILPLCSSLERPRPEVPVTNSTNIVDIQGVSLRQFWNLKNHMQDASVLATAHYPETLDRIFIIGAPSFFPTVWGWIKRWFDPVTVSKIFILQRSDVLPTLEKFMDHDAIPKKYGGQLNWGWGQPPALDEETREALERDGNKGWVKGPALWLNNERVVVGSQNGQLRRSDKEIAEKKPIIYAADYTEVPVHPEKRRDSILSGHQKSISSKHAPTVGAVPPAESPSTLVEEKQTAPAVAAVAAPAASTATTSNIDQRPTTPPKQATTIPTPLSPASIRNSPMGDSQVHIPDAQPAQPATTAEYISPVASTEAVSSNPTASPPMPAREPEVPAAAPHIEPTTTTPVAAAAAATMSQPSTTIETHPPPGHTQPGALPRHTVELNHKIANQLQQESTVTIPADANGVLPHPDIVVASDGTKGLAMEADKLSLADRTSGRPQPERFVTAMEIPQH